jgi:hypothetical protein
MPCRRLLVLFALFSTGMHAQWLNYPTPGVPRTSDGKPDLTAPAPRAPDGKPDLSGVWHVQPISLAEWKRILGDRFEAEYRVRTIGMELESISPYGINIFMDFEPEPAPMRPAAAEISRRPAACLSASPPTLCSPSRIRSFSRFG